MPWYSRKCQTNISQTSGGCQIFLGSIVVQVLVDLRCLRLGLIVGRSLRLWRSTFNLFRNKILKLNIFKFNCNRKKMSKNLLKIQEKSSNPSPSCDKFLEPVCCKKRQKIVPDQLLVWGVGDLWRTWRIPNWFWMSLSYSHDHLGSVWYHSEPSEGPYSPNQ